MSLMGVDIGSSRCKAVVFESSGRVVAESVTEYQAEFPGPAMVEMDAEVLWQAAATAVRTAASQSGDDPVEAVGLSSHGETFVPVDARGEAMGPAVLNADNRATAESKWWEELLGRKRIFEITGMIAHPMYPMAKIRWMRTHQPALFASASRFVGISEYFLLKLGMEPIVGYSLASRFMAFDVRAREWSAEMLEAAELSAERLPVPAPAGTSAGKLSRAAAGELGLRPGTPVVVAGHDQPCGALGVGAIQQGMVANSIGTWECLTAVGEEPSLDEAALAGSVNSYCHVVPDQYITIAYFPSGMMVKWFCDNFCGEDAAEARERGVDLYGLLEERSPEGPTGLCVTPHLVGSANPHFDPRATGVIVGIGQTTDRYALYRGILEGLACELAIVSEMLAGVVGEFDTIRCTGGGARSRLGLELRAAMTGRRMQTLEIAEAVCLGAALLAGLAAGAYGSLEEAVGQVVKVGETIEPDGELSAAYGRQMKQYRLLYPALGALREV